MTSWTTNGRAMAAIALSSLLTLPVAAGEAVFPLPASDERGAVLENLRAAVTATTGSIDLLISDVIDEAAFSEVLAILETARVPVRVSVTLVTPGRGTLLNRMEAFGARRSPAWAVCRYWWIRDNDAFVVSEIREFLSGSIIFIDNGDASGTPVNPDDDTDHSLLVDPAFAGVVSADLRRVSDPHEYWTAATAIWHRAALVPNLAGVEITDGRLLRAGWRDGC